VDSPSTRTRRLRILYSFPDTIGAPGIGVIALNHVRGLVERGHEVVVACTYAQTPLGEETEVIETLNVAGRRVPHRALGRARAYRRHDRIAARTVSSRAGSFDVVHCWPRASLATAAAARDLGVPSVRELPNTHTAYAYEVVAAELDRLGLEDVAGHSHTPDADALALEEAEFQAADVLAAPSEFVRRTFLDRGFDPERVLLHRYGFDPERFPPRGDIGEHGGGVTALFMGRCEPRKGLHHALRAWIDSGAAEQGRFVVCGTFFPGYREVLGDLLDHPSVELPGFTSNPSDVMRAADVLVLPSVEEGSALVTYEAQASGCALLVSDATGARCEHGVHGLIHATGDVEALTGHFHLLDGDRALLATLQRNASAHREELTWARAAAALEELYLAVAG
jgi:glycosyltransferase involved in cell wall biosynthesis